MEKTSKYNENRITLKDFIGWVVIILAALISTKFFNNFKDSELVKYFFISLATSLFTTLIWIKIFINKKDNKLFNRLLKEIEIKKDLERQKEKLEESLKWSQTFCSHEEKNELEKENKKLKNKGDQLMFVLSWCGFLQKEVGIDENISLLEWEKKSEIQRIKEEIIEKTYGEKQELEKEISNLSIQLEKECGISKDKQNVSDKRKRGWAINDVETYWRVYSKNGKKINGKTITMVLWENWERTFDNKEGDDIAIERDKLIKLIIDAATKK